MNINATKFFITTFGCQMNVHESEKIAGILNNIGYVKTDNLDNADIIVFNTCCVRNTAEQKIMSKIGDLKALKKRNKNLIIAIVGCMTQQVTVAKDIAKRFNFVDIILGTNNYLDLDIYVKEIIDRRKIRSKKIIDIKPLNNHDIKEKFIIKRDSKIKAFVNITFGCNNFCSYCIVPYVRGPERSRDPINIINEIKSLLSKGVKEVTLLGQNVNSYSHSNYDFSCLLKDIDALEGDFWIRFISSHPKDFSESIVETIASSKHLCPSIHLPLQSGSDKILKLMNRKYTQEQYLNIIQSIRRNIPNACVTTDIIVGFPEETEQDFVETLKVVNLSKFANAFTFIYSPRKDTPASKMEQVADTIKRKRIQKLIAVQNEISKEQSYKYVNNIYKTLIESYDKNRKILIGRLFDGRQVNISSDKSSMIGEFKHVKIISSSISALKGEIIYD